MKTYTFFSDNGHGWTRVPLSDVIACGIASEISGYSYISKGRRYLYLEEDSDTAKFFKASGLVKNGICDNAKVTIKYKNVNGWSRIRDLPRFNSENI